MADQYIITPTPSGALNEDPGPCLQCLADSELNALIAYAVAIIGYGAVSPVDLAKAVDCWTCISEKQFKQILANAILQYGGATGQFDESTVISDMACMKCLTPEQVRGLILKSFIYWVNRQTPQ